MVQLGQEHALERIKLCLLLRPEVVQVRVVDNIQSTGELLLVLVVAFGLLAQFQERLLNLDVWQRVDATELIDTHLRHLVLTSHVRETVDNPRSLVITTVSIGVTSHIVCLGRQQSEISRIDQLEDMLAPRNNVLPRIDVVPEVRKSVSPCSQQQLQFGGFGVQIPLVGL